jgi:UDP-3-O-acyl-N-acetylglucosamine deacetylase
MTKITITVEFTEAEFERMVQEAGMQITDAAKFKEILASKTFAQDLAEDLKQVWTETNIDCDMQEVFEGLGLGECVDF